MPDREKFGAQMEEQLSHLKAKIDNTKAKAESKGQAFLNKYENDLTKLESKYDLARYKLSLLRKGSQSAWHELKDGIENAMHDLKDALGKAKDKF
jgi:DNA-binding protein HU-beta